MEISLALLRYEPTTPCLDATLTVAESSRGGDKQTGHVNGAPAGHSAARCTRGKRRGGRTPPAVAGSAVSS